MAIVFFCDRAFNSVIGVECIFIILLMAFSVFEFFHVQDYFAVYAKGRPDGTGLQVYAGGALDSDEPVSPLVEEHRFEMLSSTRNRFMQDEVIKSAVRDRQRDDDDDDLRGSPRDSSEPKKKRALDDTSDMDNEDFDDDEEEDGAANDDDDDDETELEEGLPKTVRGALNEQKTNALIADLLLKAMQCTAKTDARDIKRAVLKFKRKMQAGRASQRASSSATGTATHDSEF
jgi:hypothetical protein